MIPALGNGLRERKEKDDPLLVSYLKIRTLLVRTVSPYTELFFSLNDKT